MKYCEKCGLPILDSDQTQCIAAEGGYMAWLHSDCWVAKSFVIAKGKDIKKYGGAVPSGKAEDIIDANIMEDINE